MSARSFPASEDSTSASPEQDSRTDSSVSPTPSADESSPDTGRGSRCTRTFVRSHIRNETEDADRWGEQEVANALAAEPLNGIPGHTLTTWCLHPDAKREGEAKTPSADAEGNVRLRDPGLGLTTDESFTLGTGEPPSIFSAEDSHAKTSPSPADEQDSQESDPAFSSSSPESQMSLLETGDGFLSRTSPDCFLPRVDEISPSFSQRWPTSGFLTSPTGLSTVATSECPNGGGASSSLPDVLQDEVPPRFYLSPRAAAGILRRAEKRGRELPQALRSALLALSTAGEEDGDLEPTKARPASFSPWPGYPLTPAPRSDRIPDQEATASRGSSVRRLTPTECERLQGMPDTWTIPTGPTLAPMDPATQPAGMR